MCRSISMFWLGGGGALNTCTKAVRDLHKHVAVLYPLSYHFGLPCFPTLL